ncbi:MAG: thioredoxin [Alphaproteobacteria bacterium]
MTTATFMRDVIEASRNQLIVVDFWAPWCGPCRQLTPMLEKVAANFAGRATLVKINIDDNPEIAGKMHIQSIPAVFAFKDGKPVDGFMGAVPESEVTKFFEKSAGPANPQTDEALDAARADLEAGEIGRAAQGFAAVLRVEQQNAGAIAGLVKCLVKTGELDRARQTLALAPAPNGPGGAGEDPQITSARAALELAERAQEGVADLAPLKAAIEADPNDHGARIKLAVALNGIDDREAALDVLVESIRRDRAWNEEEARKQLLVFFQAWGMGDPLTLKGRRALSSILFS